MSHSFVLTNLLAPAQSAIRNKLYDYYDPALPGAEASKFVGSGLSVDSAWREVWSGLWSLGALLVI